MGHYMIRFSIAIFLLTLTFILFGLNRSQAHLPDPPSAPQNLSVTQLNFDELHVRWDNVSEADDYKVYRKEKNGSYSLIATTIFTHYDDDTILDGTKYFYKVKARNSGGSSPYSNEDSRWSWLLGVGNFYVLREDSEMVSLHWVPSQSATADEVVIERQINGGGYSEIASLGMSASEHIDDFEFQPTITINHTDTIDYKIHTERLANGDPGDPDTSPRISAHLQFGIIAPLDPGIWHMYNLPHKVFNIQEFDPNVDILNEAGNSIKANFDMEYVSIRDPSIFYKDEKFHIFFTLIFDHTDTKLFAQNPTITENIDHSTMRNWTVAKTGTTDFQNYDDIRIIADIEAIDEEDPGRKGFASPDFIIEYIPDENQPLKKKYMLPIQTYTPDDGIPFGGTGDSRLFYIVNDPDLDGGTFTDWTAPANYPTSANSGPTANVNYPAVAGGPPTPQWSHARKIDIAIHGDTTVNWIMLHKTGPEAFALWQNDDLGAYSEIDNLPVNFGEIGEYEDLSANDFLFAAERKDSHDYSEHPEYFHLSGMENPQLGQSIPVTLPAKAPSFQYFVLFQGSQGAEDTAQITYKRGIALATINTSDLSQWIQTERVLLYEGEQSDGVSGTGVTAIAQQSFGPIDITGLTKADGLLIIDLKASSLGENENLEIKLSESQIEITSSGQADQSEWHYDVPNILNDTGVSIINDWRTFRIPLSKFSSTDGTQGPLDPSNINYIRWYAIMTSGESVTINWRNALIRHNLVTSWEHYKLFIEATDWAPGGLTAGCYLNQDGPFTVTILGQMFDLPPLMVYHAEDIAQGYPDVDFGELTFEYPRYINPTSGEEEAPLRDRGFLGIGYFDPDDPNYNAAVDGSYGWIFNRFWNDP